MKTNAEAVLPNDPIQLINYGGELLKLGEFSKAVQLYNKALTINPEDEEGHFGLAVAYSRMGRTNEAVKHYEDALKIFPDLHTAARHWVRFGKRFIPDPVKATYYHRRAGQYKALLQSLNHWATQPPSSI